MNLLGVDIGATVIKYGVFDPHRATIAEENERTAATLDAFLDQIAGLIEWAHTRHGVVAAGIGVPGFIAKSEKRLLQSPNLLFLNDILIEKEIQSRSAIPVIVENDANFAAWGEYSSLPEPVPASFVHLTLGTGIGSGIILDRHLWQGDCGFAAEFGHVVLNPEGRSCGCGGRGCAETESSEKGIIASFHEAGGDKEVRSSLEIHARYRAGDPAARKAFDRAGRFLGLLCVAIVNSLNPTLISIGGGVAAAGDAIMQPALAEFRSRIHRFAFACTTIRAARLGNRAGIVGAASFAAGRQK